MRTLKGLRKRKPTFTIAKWLVWFHGLSLLPANEVEVAFVEDVVSDMPDDERFRKFADYVVENYLDAGCDFSPILWAESPDLNPATTNGCESYHAHLNNNNNSSFILTADNPQLIYNKLPRRTAQIGPTIEHKEPVIIQPNITYTV